MAAQAGAQRAEVKHGWRMSRRTRDNIAGFLFISPWLLHFFALIAFAMAYSLWISLNETDLFTWKFIGLKNYTRIVEDPLFWKSLRVTAYYTFALVPLGI